MDLRRRAFVWWAAVACAALPYGVLRVAAETSSVCVAGYSLEGFAGYLAVVLRPLVPAAILFLPVILTVFGLSGQAAQTVVRRGVTSVASVMAICGTLLVLEVSAGCTPVVEGTALTCYGVAAVLLMRSGGPRLRNWSAAASRGRYMMISAAVVAAIPAIAMAGAVLLSTGPNTGDLQVGPIETAWLAYAAFAAVLAMAAGHIAAAWAFDRPWAASVTIYGSLAVSGTLAIMSSLGVFTSDAGHFEGGLMGSGPWAAVYDILVTEVPVFCGLLAVVIAALAGRFRPVEIGLSTARPRRTSSIMITAVVVASANVLFLWILGEGKGNTWCLRVLGENINTWQPDLESVAWLSWLASATPVLLGPILGGVALAMRSAHRKYATLSIAAIAAAAAGTFPTLMTAAWASMCPGQTTSVTIADIAPPLVAPVGILVLIAVEMRPDRTL